jgi:hypothetical protein
MPQALPLRTNPPAFLPLIFPSAPSTRAPTPIHDLRPSLDTTRTTHHPSAKLHYNIIKPDEDRNDIPTRRPLTPPQCSTQLLHNRFPGNISCQAIHNVTTLAAKKATTESQWTGPIIDIEEYYYGVLHPVTKHTITHDRKLMNDPHLKDLWVPAMSKEIHRLAQGKPGVTKDTNTIFVLTHSEIRHIPSN